MAACPRGQAIPWQRVVAAGGRIVIREPFASLQRRLLESEGVRLLHGRVVFSDHLWQPTRALRQKPSQRGPKRPARKKRRG
jgi:alkylated DNA nucleotide flippase Atl1